MQGISDIAEILAQNNLYDVVLSPGSRCAPLTNAVVHHSKLKTYSVIDERSAGFYAVGMSLATKKSTTLICTSGSAGLNYAPSVAEAYFQEIPLLILTADRPEELIDQYDGQTIFQKELFGRHVKKAFETSPNASKKDAHTIIQKAIKLANSKPYGPVHINIPLREPLYSEKEIKYSKEDFLIEYSEKDNFIINNNLKEVISESKNVIIILGQGSPNLKLENELQKLKGVVILKDVHSNSNIGITENDFFNYEEMPKPDLVISVNKSLISKSLKLYLKGLKGLKHIHIGTDRIEPNTFNCLIGKITGEPEHVLPKLSISSSKDFYSKWDFENTLIADKKNLFFQNKENTEMDFYWSVLSKTIENSHIHFANSMAIRYGNFLQNIINPSNEIFCNRGTSGIDGSTSTAAGFSLKREIPNLLLTGDLSFFYDRNAFWNPNFPTNLKVIVFNNQGGGIFNMIPGPGLHKTSKEYFTTPRTHSAQHLAEEFNIQYFQSRDIHHFDELLTSFNNFEGAAILEIYTDQEANSERVKKLKDFILH